MFTDVACSRTDAIVNDNMNGETQIIDITENGNLL